MSQEAKPYIILVVEDDHGLSHLVEKVLKREGFQVSTAVTGAEALSWIGKNRADLMLLDLNLPDMSGEEVLAGIKKQRYTPPFVVMTSNGNEKLAALFMKRGALDYITKDVSFLELLPSVVEQALHQLENQRGLKESNENLRKSEHLAQIQASRLATLESLSRQIASHLDTRDLLDSIVRAAKQLLNADLARLHRLCLDGETLLGISAAGPIQSATRFDRVLFKQYPIFREIIYERRSVVVEDVQTDPRWAASEWAKKERVHSYLGVPLVIHGQVEGILSCLSRTPVFFDDSDVKLTETLAFHASLAIENAKAYEELRVRSERQRTLQDITRELTQNLQPTALFNKICEAVCKLLNAPFSHLFVLDDNRENFVRVGKCGEIKGFDDQGFFFPKEGGMVGRIAREQKPICVSNVLQDPSWVAREWADKAGVKNFLGVPLFLDGEVGGVLNVFTTDDREFQPDEIELMKTFTEQAAIGIRNANLHHKISSSEKQFRTLFEKGQDGIEILDESGRYLDVNQRACEILGYSREELIGKLLMDILKPEFRNSFSERVQNTLNGKMEPYEVTALRKDGTAVPLEVNSGPIELDGKRQIISFIRDITERKRAEAEIRAAQLRLKNILDTASDAIISTDQSQHIILFNQQAEDIFGYQAEEVFRQPLEMLLPARFRANHKDHVKRFAREDAPRKMISNRSKLFGVRKSGEEFPVEVTIGKCEMEDNLIFTAVVRDVTKRMQAEEEIHNVHMETKQLLSSVPSILIGLDQDERVTLWNPKAESVFQIPATVATGLPLLECGIDCDTALLSSLILDCRRQTQPVRSPDIKYTRPDGKDGLLGFTATRIGDEGNGKRGLLLVGAELTERRFLETQLVQAQKLESIGQLAAGIAHEINTPTQYVADNTHFLSDAFGDLSRLLELCGEIAKAEKSGTSPSALIQEMEASIQEADLDYLKNEIPHAIQQSLDGIDRVSKIVRAMKEFSHPGPEGKTKTDLNRLIENTITVSRNEWKYVAEMVTELDPQLPLTLCHPNEFNQVILNIIINAAHAIGDVVGDGIGGKGTVTVSTHHKGDWAEIRIRDTGNGIPPHVRSKVFDPFFTTKGVGKGTGQGLAIAHSVIKEKHNGSISFETEEGKGTTFIIRLPIGEESP